MLKNFSEFLRDLWTLTRPYWGSEERWTAWLLLGVIVAMNMGLIYLSVVINQWQRLFFNALQARDHAEYVHQFIRFGGLALIHIVITVYALYLDLMLQIRWRRWLTARYLDDWLAGQTYYRLQIGGGETDNPDQRIAEDARAFVNLTLGLTLGFLSTVVTLVSFLGILWGLSGALVLPWGEGGEIAIPGYMVWAALLYAVIGTWFNHLVGRPLSRLNFDQQRVEADFRFSLVRLRENAEGVALYGGEGPEGDGFRRRFDAVVRNWRAIMTTRKSLTWFASGYSQVAIVSPYVVAAPRYFAGAMQLGDLMQTASAFGKVEGSLSWFIGAYVSLAEWRATVRRLTSFRAAMAASRAQAAAAGGIVRGEGDDAATLRVDGLTLALPHDANPLLSADLIVSAGETVLISGRSGSGKSTLFRALAGIWPYGRGRIRLPAGASLLFLPQKPYLPIGPLRAAVAYPAPPDRFSDAELTDALGACGASALAGRLDEADHWGQRLSPGEQQRLAVARALLNRPDWLFLDEATSACDPETEAGLYRLLAERLPATTVISIGHRTSLHAFHRRRLVVEPDGRGIGRLAAATA